MIRLSNTFYGNDELDGKISSVNQGEGLVCGAENVEASSVSKSMTLVELNKWMFSHIEHCMQLLNQHYDKIYLRPYLPAYDFTGLIFNEVYLISSVRECMFSIKYHLNLLMQASKPILSDPINIFQNNTRVRVLAFNNGVSIDPSCLSVKYLTQWRACEDPEILKLDRLIIEFNDRMKAFNEMACQLIKFLNEKSDFLSDNITHTQLEHQLFSLYPPQLQGDGAAFSRRV